MTPFLSDKTRLASKEKAMKLVFVAAVFALLSSLTYARISDVQQQDASPPLCPCANPDHCAPVARTTPLSKEVFAYCIHCADWRSYDWSRLSTLAVSNHYFEPWNSELMCYAHSQGVKVVLWTPRVMGDPGQNTVGNITNATLRRAWVNYTMQRVSRWFLDGVNVDFEDENADADNDVSLALTELMRELRAGLDATIVTTPSRPRGQLTFDPVWSPVYSMIRRYQYGLIASIVDYVVVMDYVDHIGHLHDDGSSQPCVAGSDAPLPAVVMGFKEFFAECKKSIITRGDEDERADVLCSPSKFVMGLAQSGFAMPCLPGTAPTAAACPLALAPARGYNCTYINGHEVPFVNLMQVIRMQHDRVYGPDLIRTTNLVVNDTVASATFNYVDNSSSSGSSSSSSSPPVWQVWMETPATAAQKWTVARQMGLGGAMMWNLDWLNYTTAQPQRTDTVDWFQALDAILGS